MTYLVEFFLPSQAHERVDDWTSRADVAAAELRAGGASVRCTGSFLVAADDTCFLRFEARSAALVEEAVRRAHIQFERILKADEHAPPDSRPKGEQ